MAENQDFAKDSPEGAVVEVRTQPRASRAGLCGVAAGALKVRVCSAPVDGKANKELAETLADAFGIPKSAVVIKSGETSKNKRILLRGVPAAKVLEVVNT